ncbi:hypothetical protein CLOM621_07401 [Clostridium sp. M62/1]|nr:hypothetical protein CLOM621_07401 [Clostridium sp. M62/1]
MVIAYPLPSYSVSSKLYFFTPYNQLESIFICSMIFLSPSFTN